MSASYLSKETEAFNGFLYTFGRRHVKCVGFVDVASSMIWAYVVTMKFVLSAMGKRPVTFLFAGQVSSSLVHRGSSVWPVRNGCWKFGEHLWCRPSLELDSDMYKLQLAKFLIPHGCQMLAWEAARFIGTIFSKDDSFAGSSPLITAVVRSRCMQQL